MDRWPAWDAHDVAMALFIALIAAILLSVISCIVSREQSHGIQPRLPPTLPTRERKPKRGRKPNGESKPKSERKRKVEVIQEENQPVRVRQSATPAPSQPAKPLPQQPSRPACRASSKGEVRVQAPSQAHAAPKRQSNGRTTSEEDHVNWHRVDPEVLSSSLWATAVLRCMNKKEEGFNNEAARTSHGENTPSLPFVPNVFN